MSLSCWRAIGSPEVRQSPTTLKAFDGLGFQPYGLIPSLAITLGGKTVSIHVEIVDATLDYNILLGWNWFYAMIAVASSVFRMVQFPHQGQIVTIDQLSFYSLETSNTDTNSVPAIGQTKPHYEDIGISLLKDSSIIGVFPEVPSPYAMVNMIA